MRIAYVVNTFPSVSQTFVLNQMTGMIDRGHDVTIFAVRRDTAMPVSPLIERYRLLARTRYLGAKPNGSRWGHGTMLAMLAREAVVRPGVAWRVAAARRRCDPLIGYRHLVMLRPWIEAGPFDLVHAQFGPQGLMALGMRLLGAWRGPLVTSFRGYDVMRDVPAQPDLYRRLFAEGEYFLPVSASLREQLVAHGCDPGRTEIHYSGIELARFPFVKRQRSAGDPVHLLCVGRLVDKKGFADVIAAVAKLVAEGRPVRCTIVGDGPLRETLERQIARLGLSERVQLAGPGAHEDVIARMQCADLLVAPSVTAANGDQEGIPNVIKEAMAAGLPVISTRHGGIPELVVDGETGWLVPERDPTALADRLRLWMDQPGRGRGMSRAGRAQVEAKFDASQLNDRLDAIYRSLTA
ncbi:MAG: glycosyltransferase [Phycisphaeraceae bacterium]